jgi:hypothetical protein
VSTKPTTELGYVHADESVNNIPGIFKVPDWGDWNIDAGEYVAALKWPQSISTFTKMRSDPQVEGLLRGMTLPIRRFTWLLEPGGSKITNDVAQDLHLPIKGRKRMPKDRRNRFNWDRFLQACMLFLPYGHMFWEKDGVIEDDVWRLDALSERMPESINSIKIDRQGMLEWIKQNEGYEPPKIELARLVPFAFEREGANWFGRSLLRSAYQPWLLKDRLLRVDAIRHERNGMGIPIVGLPERATEEQRQAAAKLASQYAAGMASGGALPFGMSLELVGVTGTVSDVLASIRYHDEAMAKLMLQMFTQLGGGGDTTGSKALGEVFVKFFSQAQDAVADFIADTLNEFLLIPWTEWNYGEDEQPPKIIFTRDEDPELSAHELAQMVGQNIITVDTELENFLRDKYGLIQLKGERPDPQDFGLPPADGSPDTPPEGQPNENVNQPPATRPASDKQASSGVLDLKTRFRRQMTMVEAASGADFDRLQREWEEAVRVAVAIFGPVRAAQIEELALAAGEAKTVEGLAKISATPGGEDDLAELLSKVATSGTDAALGELLVQGKQLPRPGELSMRGQATATVGIIARSLGASASRVAANSGTGQTASDAVRSWGSKLSDAYLEETLGSALTSAQNAGRYAVYGQDAGSFHVYASEIMDANTCTFCAQNDGKQYVSMEEGLADYPTGQYVGCVAGPRCRGTLIFVTR